MSLFGSVSSAIDPWEDPASAGIFGEHPTAYAGMIYERLVVEL
jgi:hypothetical protein